MGDRYGEIDAANDCNGCNTADGRIWSIAGIHLIEFATTLQS